nr:hypothetical protein [Tanacetum cinerariifolium]
KEDPAMVEGQSHRGVIEGDEVKGIQSKNSKEDDKNKKCLPNCNDIVMKDNGYVLCGNRGMLKVAWKALVKMRMNGSIMGENSGDADWIWEDSEKTIILLTHAVISVKWGLSDSRGKDLSNPKCFIQSEGATRSIGKRHVGYLAKLGIINGSLIFADGPKGRKRKKLLIFRLMVVDKKMLKVQHQHTELLMELNNGNLRKRSEMNVKEMKHVGIIENYVIFGLMRTKKGANNMGNASNSASMLKNTDTSNNDNITSLNTFSALNVEDKEEEDVENVYDEMANLFTNTKTGRKGGNVLIKKLLDLDSTKDLHPPHNINPLNVSTTSSSFTNHLLEEFNDELTIITFLPEYDDDLTFDIDNLADNLVDTVPEMFIEEHAPDYSYHLVYDEYDDDLFKVESDTEYVYDDPFDSKGKKIKE